MKIKYILQEIVWSTTGQTSRGATITSCKTGKSYSFYDPHSNAGTLIRQAIGIGASDFFSSAHHSTDYVSRDVWRNFSMGVDRFNSQEMIEQLGEEADEPI